MTLKPSGLTGMVRPSSGASASPLRIQKTFLRRPKEDDPSDKKDTLLETQRRETSSISGHPLSLLGVAQASETTRDQMFSAGGRHGEHQQQDAAYISKEEEYSDISRPEEEQDQQQNTSRIPVRKVFTDKLRLGQAQNQQHDTFRIPVRKAFSDRPRLGQARNQQKNTSHTPGRHRQRPRKAQIQNKNTSHNPDRQVSLDRVKLGKIRNQQENNSLVPDKQVSIDRPRSGEVEEQEKQKEKNRGGVSTRPGAAQPQRAVCLWASFRHFFASCSVTQRLRAVCEYTAGT